MEKHIPLRTCLVCRRRLEKQELHRFVRDDDGFLLYDAGKSLPGRGFYLCCRGGCLEKYLQLPRKYSNRYGIKGIAPGSLEQLEKVGPIESAKK
ncbi:MAG: DUF448 domain-containing protein [Deltaproteobacteria bacterium]|nr:MAG: DUF448 domain-containing protein [Deltaproteobacteria bacterium]